MGSHDGRRASRPSIPARPPGPHRGQCPGADHRPRHARAAPSSRPAGGRACLLRRRRAPERRPAPLRPDGDDRRPGLLPISAAARDRVPAARAAPVRDGRAHLGGVPHRAVRGHARAPGTAQRVDMDRQRLAGRTHRLEPCRGPGAGRGHLPRRARGALGGGPGGAPEDPAGHRGHLLARAARLACGRAVRGVVRGPVRPDVRPGAGRHDRVHRVLRPGPGR